jgi:hypothetical protein
MKQRILIGTLLFLMAIALTTAPTYAVSMNAPGQQWTVGTRVYNPQRTLIFHTSHATSGSGVIAQFDVPSSAYGFTDYLYGSKIALTPGSTITARITIKASSEALFEAGPWGGQGESAPAVVYLFFQANTPVDKADQASCMPPGYGANNYWWAAAVQITDPSGALLGTTFVLTASLDPSAWRGICGQTATPEAVAEALASATDVGLALGGGYPSHFGANGIALTAGTATFELESYTVS